MCLSFPVHTLIVMLHLVIVAHYIYIYIYIYIYRERERERERERFHEVTELFMLVVFDMYLSGK
jgi:hypothetical protein